MRERRPLNFNGNERGFLGAPFSTRPYFLQLGTSIILIAVSVERVYGRRNLDLVNGKVAAWADVRGTS